MKKVRCKWFLIQLPKHTFPKFGFEVETTDPAFGQTPRPDFRLAWGKGRGWGYTYSGAMRLHVSKQLSTLVITVPCLLSWKKENIQHCFLFWFLHVKANLVINEDMDGKLIRKKLTYPVTTSHKNIVNPSTHLTENV